MEQAASDDGELAVAPSVPEPDPVPAGREVTPVLLEWVSQNIREDDYDGSVTKLIKQRDAFGREKYGQPLMSGDGRNDLEDLRQELGDALQYACKARMNGKNVKSVIPLVLALASMVGGDGEIERVAAK